MFLKPLFLILISLTSYYSMGQLRPEAEKATCFHPQACFLLDEIKTRIPHLSINKITLNSFDPHHGEFSSKVFKSLLSAEKIIFPPLELNSSYRKIYNLRKKKDFLLSDGHFWLSPVQYCKNKNKLEALFNLSPSICEINNFVTSQTMENFQKFQYIISHNSFEHWFKKMGLKFTVIDTHGHHSKMSSSTLKKIINNLKDPSKKVIWLHESQFPIPSFLKNYTSKAHKLIKLNTFSSTPQAIYSTLANEIK